MKVFPHGKGAGAGPVHYLLRRDYPGRDDAPPAVLRGDPELTVQLIDSQPRTWKFTAGVLSWAPGEEISDEKERRVMDDFERVAFAGLEPDQYNILWVRHVHAEHHELHFVIPRMELSTGKALNPCPPGWQKDFDVFRDLYNWREGWARPDDPTRARAYKPSHTDLNRARRIRWGQATQDDKQDDPRKLINEFISQRIESGLVTNREELVQALHEVGLKTPRMGKNYLTVLEPDSGTRFRMKGGIYCEHWRVEQQAQGQDSARPGGAGVDSTARVRELATELEQVIARRAEYNRSRYRSQNREPGQSHCHTASRADRPNDNVAQVSSQDLAANHGARILPAYGPDSGNMGTEFDYERTYHQSMATDQSTPSKKETVEGDSFKLGKTNMGDSASAKRRQPLHSSASKGDNSRRVEFQKSQSAQAGVSNEYDRAGTPPSGWPEEARTRVSRDQRNVRQTIEYDGRGTTVTGTTHTAAQRVLQKLGAAVRAIERVIAQREVDKQLRDAKGQDLGL